MQGTQASALIRVAKRAAGRKQLFSDIQQRLLEVLEKRPEGKSYTPDFVPVKGRSQRGSTPQRILARPKQERTNREGDGEEIETGTGRGGGRGGGGGRGRKRSVRRQLMVPASSPVPIGSDRIELDIGPSVKTVNNVILYLETRTGSDATCEAPLRGQEAKLDLSRCYRDGEALRNRRGTDTEVQLGKLDQGLSTRLTLQLANDDYDISQLRAVLYEGGRK